MFYLFFSATKLAMYAMFGIKNVQIVQVDL